MDTTWEQGPIGFGDSVRVLTTAVTEEAGVAGLQGQVYGETTPSVTDVDVIGSADDDYAINVHFEDEADGLWFAPDLLELVDHAPGTIIRLDGVLKEWTRSADGEWVERSLEPSAKKPWWKFW